MDENQQNVNEGSIMAKSIGGMLPVYGGGPCLGESVMGGSTGQLFQLVSGIPETRNTSLPLANCY